MNSSTTGDWGPIHDRTKADKKILCTILTCLALPTSSPSQNFTKLLYDSFLYVYSEIMGYIYVHMFTCSHVHIHSELIISCSGLSFFWANNECHSLPSYFGRDEEAWRRQLLAHYLAHVQGRGLNQATFRHVNVGPKPFFHQNVHSFCFWPVRPVLITF